MKQQRNFDLHKFFTISAIVMGVGFFLTSLILSRIVFNERDGAREKEPVQAPSARRTVSRPVVSDTQQKEAAKAKEQPHPVSTSTTERENRLAPLLQIPCLRPPGTGHTI